MFFRLYNIVHTLDRLVVVPLSDGGMVDDSIGWFFSYKRWTPLLQKKNYQRRESRLRCRVGILDV